MDVEHDDEMVMIILSPFIFVLFSPIGIIHFLVLFAKILLSFWYYDNMYLRGGYIGK